MAAIIEFTKPVPWGVGATTGAEHSFILLQNDAGQYVEIARGGPQNDNPLNWGQITATVAPYTRDADISGKAANDFYSNAELATMQSQVLKTGTEEEMQAAFDRLAADVAPAINQLQAPYVATEYNSNSVTTTFAAALGATPLQNQGYNSGQWIPGAENNLLPDIYKSGDFGIGGGDSNYRPDLGAANPDIYTSGDFGIGGGNSNYQPDLGTANPDIYTSGDFGIGGGDSNAGAPAYNGSPQDVLPDYGQGSYNAPTPGSEAFSPDLSGPPAQFDPNGASTQGGNVADNAKSAAGSSGDMGKGGAGNDSLPAFTDPGTTTPTNDGFNPTNDGSSSSYPTSVTTNDGSSSSYPTNVGSYPTNVGSYPTNVGSYPTNAGSYPTNGGSYPTNGGSYPGSSGGGGYGGGGYGGGGYGGGYGGGGYGGGYPIVLDLTGKGINIQQLSSSNTFFDMTGSGHQHLTAWAGPGNGVLFYDPTGTGQLTQANQIIFTDWDPTAHSDMQALLDVFDTNHDGSLDAGDANFADFYVMETNADGTQTAVSLASLGITSINLNADATHIALPDGSSIDGETTFTTSSGTGTAATVRLAADPMGAVVTTTTTTNADGSVTVDNTAENADGRVAYQRILRWSDRGRYRFSPLWRSRGGRGEGTGRSPLVHSSSLFRPSSAAVRAHRSCHGKAQSADQNNLRRVTQMGGGGQWAAIYDGREVGRSA